MGKYEYNLSDQIDLDFTDSQSQKLFDKGYVFNREDNSYDLYQEVKEAKTFVDFVYKNEIETLSYLSEYEVYTTKKTFDVSYKILKKETGFTGFFKNIFNKFLKKKEKNVTEKRISELELMLSRGEINDLKKVENIVGSSEIKTLTDREISELKSKGIKHTFVRNTDKQVTEKSLEKVKMSGILKEDFEKNYSDFDTEILAEYEEEILKEKIVIDRRIKMQNTLNYYVPGIWSQNGAHEYGSKAEFSCQVNINFISGFNPIDPEFFDEKIVKERVIEIINHEHPTTAYIREREDNMDGFNIENPTF